MINGQERYLFREEDRWFVEAKASCESKYVEATDMIEISVGKPRDKSICRWLFLLHSR